MIIRSLRKLSLLSLITLIVISITGCIRKNVTIIQYPPFVLTPSNPQQEVKVPGEVELDSEEPIIQKIKKTKYNITEIRPAVYQQFIFVYIDFEDDHICDCGEIYNFTVEEQEITVNFYVDDTLIKSYKLILNPLTEYNIISEEELSIVLMANRVEVVGFKFCPTDTDYTPEVTYETNDSGENEIRENPVETAHPANTIYYYERRYVFSGILRQDSEDLCETGEPHTYFYIEIDPIDMTYEGDDSEFEEPRYGVNKLQLHSYDFSPDEIDKPITVSGNLVFNIAGCRNHTEAYLEDVTKEQ